jgi:hypothetical protein
VVLAALVVVGSLGPAYGISAFFRVSKELHWSILIGNAQSISLWAILSVDPRRFQIDRIGSRKTILIGGAFASSAGCCCLR